MSTGVMKSRGVLEYGPNCARVLVDREIINYYWSLIPKAKRVGLNRPYHPPHITVVRERIEKPLFDNWGYREDELIPFTYYPYIRLDEMYAWIDAWSDDIQQIRVKLGLPPLRVGYRRFHITIGNRK